MKIAIHQPNLIPWLPFFYKMEQAEIFVLMVHCQFEKNGFQNRFNVRNKWITKAVEGKTCDIKDKKYVDGQRLTDVNLPLILGLAKLLEIDTNKIHHDFSTEKKATERLISICKLFDCDEYLTNPEASDKYLDEKLMNDNGIEVVGCDLPKQYRVSIFEALETWGVDGCVKIIRKDWARCKA